MRVKKPALLLTFATTTQAMGMEKCAAEQGLPGRLIPVPGHIRAGCGLAWKAELCEEKQLMDALGKRGISCEAVFHTEL